MKYIFFRFISIVILVFLLLSFREDIFLDNNILFIPFKLFFITVLSFSLFSCLVNLFFLRNIKIQITTIRISAVLVNVLVIYTVLFFIFSDNKFQIKLIPLFVLPYFLFKVFKMILDLYYISRSFQKIKK